jgi:hypothetical protein
VAGNLNELHARTGDAALFVDDRGQRINGQWTGSPTPIQNSARSCVTASWPGGFARFRCGDSQTERLVAFSCKGRGFCPSCGGRRMADCVIGSRNPTRA